MALPSIDFSAIAAQAKEALALYGSPVTFLEGNEPTGRQVRAVIWEQLPETMLMDADTHPAFCILSPEDFAAPVHRMPIKFDRIRIEIGGMVRTYTIDADPSPILAENHLALIRVVLRAN